MTNRYFTQAAVELGNKVGVILCDRNALADMLYKLSQPGLDVTHDQFEPLLPNEESDHYKFGSVNN